MTFVPGRGSVEVVSGSEFRLVVNGTPYLRPGNCADCYWLRGHLSWWCKNPWAVAHYWTSVPGRTGCRFWDPPASVEQNRQGDAMKLSFDLTLAGTPLYWAPLIRDWTTVEPDSKPECVVTVTAIQHKDGSITIEAEGEHGTKCRCHYLKMK